MTRAVFLDRDGVINELVYHPELDVSGPPFQASDYKLMSGAAEAIHLLNLTGFLAIVISNQPDVAKGRMTLDAFEEIRRKLKEILAEASAFLDAEYYCMHHPKAVIERYKVDCDCRKPKPGMLLRAAREHSIDMSQSWFVGDNMSDIKAGKDAGCRTVLIDKTKSNSSISSDDSFLRPNMVSTDLKEAVCLIIKNNLT
jgi:D,D-heptose 1,7-bisphosphate phosphatase